MTLFNGLGIFASQAQSFPAFSLLKPSSVTAVGAGSSASIGRNGSVSATSCEHVDIDGIFTTDFDVYQIVTTGVRTTTGQAGLNAFLRVGGTTETGANYPHAFYNAYGTTVNVSNNNTTLYLGYYGNARVSTSVSHIYMPAQAQPTSWTSHIVTSQADGYIYDAGGTHTLSTAYTGLRVTISSGAFNSDIRVYGYRNVA